MAGGDACLRRGPPLGGTTVDTLRARFDPGALTDADIYPNVWADGTDEFDEYIAPYVTQLRSFYETAAANGQAVLLAIV